MTNNQYLFALGTAVDVGIVIEVEDVVESKMILREVSRKSMGGIPVDLVVFEDVVELESGTICTKVSRRSMGCTPIDEVIEGVDVVEGGIISTTVCRRSMGSTAAETIVEQSDAHTKSKARVSRNIARRWLVRCCVTFDQ